MSNVKELLGVCASFCTLLQFLSGSLTCLQYIKRKSVGDDSHIPFIAGFVSCSIWVSYGTVAQESTILTVNVIGLSLFFIYVVIHYLYSIQRNIVARDFLISLILVGAMNVYILMGIKKQILQHHIGNLASFVTLLFFAAPLVNLMHIIRSRNSNSLPIHFIFMTSVATSLWFLYGYVMQDIYIQLPNAAGFILSLFQLCLYIIYRPTDSIAMSRLKENF